jgi:transcription-repair coupling factor (superfamily II helicase)
MYLHTLLEQWTRERAFVELAHGVNTQRKYRAAVTGLDGSARVFFLAGLAEHCRRPALVVTADPARAEKIYEDLLAFFPADRVNLLPARELFITAEILTRSQEQREQRLHFLEWLYRREKGIVVAPFTAIISRMVPPEKWNRLILELRVKDSVNREALLTQLVEIGYERTPLIEGKGQFSARGEIIDIFPFGWEQPLRVELFDDLIDSIRLFDPGTQRSTGQMERAAILPAYELILPGPIFEDGEERLRGEMEQALARLRQRGEKEAAAKLKTNVEQHMNHLKEPGGLDVLSSYFSFFYGKGASLLDYLPGDFIVFVDEPSSVFEKAAILHRELEDHRSSIFLQGELLPGQLDSFWDEKALLSGTPCPLVACTLFPDSAGGLNPGREYALEHKSIPYYHGQWDLFRNDFYGWIKEGFQICLLAGSPERGAALLKSLQEMAIPVAGVLERSWSADLTAPAQMVTASLEDGFAIPALQVAVLTEHNLVPRRRKKKRLARKEGIRLRDYRDLVVGDYVVHEQHGIGKYLGLSTLEVQGVQRDFLQVKYGGSDRLYLPVDQIQLIQKYVGAEGKPPRLHGLGSGEWQRLKSKVNASVQEMARELLSLYAARQAVQGYAFGADHPWQIEFEARFPYEETPDQLQAISDVKRDLEKRQPMDRLICGDVGYGKTEVALRAAFKVAMEGKQVALLVPTTILAQQHFRTFLERFGDFPFTVAQLSRFIPAARQKEILAELARGKIDIIIGTHRLLSADVRFHDLGLLIIDEEQRFGVRHKEKLKQLRLDVDVLAMTATPIPRTLHLSLAGARDLSVIETPPENRYPVQTFVMEYSENLVKEALQRELNRQGQVYYVFNRVEGINAMAKKIQAMFPGVPVAVGHGQMPEASLERIMGEFLEGRYKILISTTIIEAGLDIPNVNTLIVYDADKFGLAQLYQIRGRVGRSNRLAYAYLTYRKEKIITEAARKRLQAIKEFTELGSGFRVALRDLEIRGAGNILGAEQHGFMVAVGFDLYCRLLEQAVAELKNVRREEPLFPRLDLKINAFFPVSYIANHNQKIDFYQRIYTLNTAEDLVEVEEELRDRYGSPPAPVRNLFAVAALRILCRQLGIELIRQQKSALEVKFYPDRVFDSQKLWSLIGATRGRITLAGGKALTLKVKIEGGDTAATIPELLRFLENLVVLARMQNEQNLA